MIEIISQSPEETKKLGEILAREILASGHQPKKARVIGLEGELGSGKTVFIQGLAKGLGIKDRIISPTFVIMKKYKINASGCRLQVSRFYHIDCYRIYRAKELLDLGFKELLSQPKNIIAIEWAERVKRILAQNTLWLKFEHLEGKKRRVIIKSKCQNPNYSKSSSKPKTQNPKII